MKCEGCQLTYPDENMATHQKGEAKYHFCDFCSSSFVSNAIMYPTVSVTNRQVLETIARSHNLIMNKLKEIKRRQ